jgi:hypothetical protein
MFGQAVLCISVYEFSIKILKEATLAKLLRLKLVFATLTLVYIVFFNNGLMTELYNPYTTLSLNHQVFPNAEFKFY